MKSVVGITVVLIAGLGVASASEAVSTGEGKVFRLKRQPAAIAVAGEGSQCCVAGCGAGEGFVSGVQFVTEGGEKSGRQVFKVRQTSKQKGRGRTYAYSVHSGDDGGPAIVTSGGHKVIIKQGKVIVDGKEIELPHGEHGFRKTIKIDGGNIVIVGDDDDDDDDDDGDDEYELFEFEGLGSGGHAIHIEGLEGLQMLHGLKGLKGLHGLAGLKGLKGLKGLHSLEGLEGLHELEGLDGLEDLLEDLDIEGIVVDALGDLDLDEIMEEHAEVIEELVEEAQEREQEVDEERIEVQQEMLELIQDLRAELRELRGEVKSLKRQMRKEGVRLF